MSVAATFRSDICIAREEVRLKLEPATPKQATLAIATAAILWIPIAVFLIFFHDKVSPRQIGLIGLLNLAVSVSLLVWIYRKWISKL